MAGDPSFDSIGEYLRTQRHMANLSLREMAHRAGVSDSYLSQVERGLYQPSAEFLRSVAKSLRVSAQTLYAHAGLIDAEDENAPDVVDAISRDRQLSEGQKQALIQMYRTLLDTSGSA